MLYRQLTGTVTPLGRIKKMRMQSILTKFIKLPSLAWPMWFILKV